MGFFDAGHGLRRWACVSTLAVAIMGKSCHHSASAADVKPAEPKVAEKISTEPASAKSAAERLYFPPRGGEWKTEAPEAHGLKKEDLVAAAAAIKAVTERYGVLFVKDGVIVHEEYWKGDKDTVNDAFSATKSFGSALAGIAVTQGKITVKDKVIDWQPINHPEVMPDSTIENILSMTSGAEPVGTVYEYNSGNRLNSLPGILWNATGVKPHDFMEKELKAPTGMTLNWPQTKNGWIQIGTQRVQGMGPMQCTHRDLARLGLLWMNGGVWDGKRLIDEDYVKAAITPPFPGANNAYGYLWWLNTDGGTWRSPTAGGGEGKILKRGPASVYYAAGANSQLMFVFPEQRLIAATMGNTPGSGAGPTGTPTTRIFDGIMKAMPELK